VLKKKMQLEGVFREMKLRGHYEKPSERRVREKAEAIRRARKLARKKLQRDGPVFLISRDLLGLRLGLVHCSILNRQHPQMSNGARRGRFSVSYFMQTSAIGRGTQTIGRLV
jgi:small subunit ribosomal protein S21